MDGPDHTDTKRMPFGFGNMLDQGDDDEDAEAAWRIYILPATPFVSDILRAKSLASSTKHMLAEEGEGYLSETAIHVMNRYIRTRILILSPISRCSRTARDASCNRSVCSSQRALDRGT